MIEYIAVNLDIYSPLKMVIERQYKGEIELKTILKIGKENDYKFWNKEDLNYIAKVDLSTPIKDNEDYSTW